MVYEKEKILFHANNSAPSSENPLLVKALSKNKAMDDTDGRAVGGLVFASGGEIGKLMGLAYAMKSKQRFNKEEEPIDPEIGTMIACSATKGSAFAVMSDRESFTANPTTGYLYELPSDKFKQVVSSITNQPVNEFISTEDVVANKVNIIKGMKIPLQEGVQIFFLKNTTAGDYRELSIELGKELESKLKAALPEADKQKIIDEAYLKLLKTLDDRGDLIYENRDRGLKHINLETGEWVEPKKSHADKISEQRKSGEEEKYLGGKRTKPEKRTGDWTDYVNGG